jgi:hypothetical protein
MVSQHPKQTLTHNHLDLLAHRHRRMRRRNRARPPLIRNANPTLHILQLPRGAHMARRKQVKLLLLGVEVTVHEEEDDTRDERDDGHGAVVPDELGVEGEGREGLSNGGREGRGEELDGHDERAHVLGRLGEGVLERGDGGEDLGDGDEDVDARDGPDGDGRLVVGVAGLVEVGRLVAEGL